MRAWWFGLGWENHALPIPCTIDQDRHNDDPARAGQSGVIILATSYLENVSAIILPCFFGEFRESTLTF